MPDPGCGAATVSDTRLYRGLPELEDIPARVQTLLTLRAASRHAVASWGEDARGLQASNSGDGATQGAGHRAHCEEISWLAIDGEPRRDALVKEGGVGMQNMCPLSWLPTGR